MAAARVSSVELRFAVAERILHGEGQVSGTGWTIPLPRTEQLRAQVTCRLWLTQTGDGKPLGRC
jgi:hypothetical protein